MPYKDIEIDESTHPNDYSYQERRHELLGFIIEAGHPDLLSRTKFAERYDVAISTITRDIQALRAEIREEMGTDAELIGEAIFQKTMKEQAKNKDFEDAVETFVSWYSWLQETGAKEKVADKREVTHAGQMDVGIGEGLSDQNQEHFAALVDEARGALDDGPASDEPDDEDE